MAVLSFKLFLDCLQSPELLPQDMMTSYEALHFGDIRFVPPQHTLNMQRVSLAYLKSLVNDNCFKPEGIKMDLYSSYTAILIVYLSDEEHKCIQHMHIGRVMCHTGCNLYMQNGILPFVKSIESDLAKVRDRCAHNKDPCGVCSYALLVANYWGIMAIPTDPLYCLVYPTMCNDDVEEKNHFNTAASPSRMHTCVCICCFLLQFMDKEGS